MNALELLGYAFLLICCAAAGYEIEQWWRRRKARERLAWFTAVSEMRHGYEDLYRPLREGRGTKENPLTMEDIQPVLNRLHELAEKESKR